MSEKDENFMTLRELKPGQQARISAVGGEGALRQHFLDMGVIPGTEVTVVKYAPMGDPMELILHGYNLTLRLADAEQIAVEPIQREQTPDGGEGEKTGTDLSGNQISSAKSEKAGEGKKGKEHPGLGETGRFHPKGSGKQLPDGKLLTFATR